MRTLVSLSWSVRQDDVMGGWVVLVFGVWTTGCNIEEGSMIHSIIASNETDVTLFPDDQREDFIGPDHCLVLSLSQ